MLRAAWILFLLTPALAQSPLKIENPWVRLTPVSLSAAYMVISNPGPKPVKIVGFSSSIAQTSELHTTITTQSKGSSVTGMRQVKEIVIPAKGKLELTPGGSHLMLVGLKQPLAEGQKVKITLKLEGGQTISIEAVVMAK